MIKNIEPGYALALTSWENDGDCYKTQQFTGLTEIDVKFLIELAKLFYSMHGHGKKGFGGGSWHYKGGSEKYYEDVYAAVDEVVKKYADAGVNPELYEQWVIDRSQEYFGDAYNQMIEELVGYPEEEMYQSDGYIRVFESFTVHFHPNVVEDVTSKFK
jgi:hypothetical protein